MCVHCVHYIYAILNRNTASESIKQKLVFVGSEEGKLLALRTTRKMGFTETSLLTLCKKC